MTLPDSDTLVSYPDGATSGTATVLHVESLSDGRIAVILDRTAVHPVDGSWPDQPADRAEFVIEGTRRTVVDAVTGGIHDGVLRVGGDLPVRMGTEGWTFVVAHVLDAPAPAVGSIVEITVDGAYRDALSAGHTACHLASLALDEALAEAWTKPAAEDPRGRPAFDALAIQSSRIVAYGSLDTYRVGKSLRRKGFDPAALDDPTALAARVDAVLAEWVRGGGAVRIDRPAEGLSTRRTWVAALPDGEAAIPCGGTHVNDLAEFAAISVVFEVTDADGGRELVMTTAAQPA